LNAGLNAAFKAAFQALYILSKPGGAGQVKNAKNALKTDGGNAKIEL
jgi:hypothetical protein